MNPPPRLRILGIDPGSRLCGWGVIDSEGSRLVHIDNGVLVLDARESLEARLLGIFARLGEVVARFHPHAAAVEQIYVARDPVAALTLGQARGAGIVACMHAGVACASYPATTVKRAVVGTGRADKEQVQQMVKVILGLPEPPQADAADALAVAICHAHHARGAPPAPVEPKARLRGGNDALAQWRAAAGRTRRR